MKRSTSTGSSSSRDTFGNYDPTVTVRSSSGSDPLVPYSPDLVIQEVQRSGLSELEIAEREQIEPLAGNGFMVWKLVTILGLEDRN